MSDKLKQHSTEAIHHPKSELPEDNFALVDPIQVSTKYYFDTYEDLENLINGNRQGYLYSRVMNPTVHTLEKTLASLQGTENGICTSSGVSSISTLLLTLLEKDDHIVYFVESYKPTRYIIEKFLNKWGIKSTIVSIRDKVAISQALEISNTKLVIFESPTNPLLHIADIEFIVKEAKRNAVQTVLDNTFAGFHNHQDLGIDYYIHSLTKFAGGHSDTMGGVILGSNKNIDKVRWPAAEIGACLSPHTAYEIQKGLKTYSLRYERSCQNAQHIAEFLEKRREITDIRYPGLDSFPQKQLANKQLKDSGCVITFKLAKNYRVSDFLNNLGLIKVSPSLGTVESLAAPVNLFYGGLLSEDNKKISEIDEQTVRLSIGIESCDDLVKDIKKALKSI